MIPPKQVQEILDATRIDDVVGDFIALRRRGTNLLGLCPFHNERTPSFNVNPARNIFKCFGCGKGGDAVTFLMEHERFTYPDAIRWLARKYNLEIQEIERNPEQVAALQLSDSLYIVNDFAARHFHEQMTRTDEGRSVAEAYFAKRGLSPETMEKFSLGYAPDQRDLLLQTARQQGYETEKLAQLGLVSSDKSRDFFRARVMFAIHNLSGKVAAFAGRTLSADKSVPKYINSPESEIYVKHKTLYGAFQAKRAIRTEDLCILVEGYMDVISLHQAGIEHVVASSGTSLTEGQLQLIKRNTNNLLILYDGDPAGVKAALRGLDLALEFDLNVRIALLPEKEDPDSYVQRFGGAALSAYLDKEAKDFILFKASLLLEEIKGDPVKKAAMIQDIVGSIALIPDEIKRSVYLQSCSALLGVDATTLTSACSRVVDAALKKKKERAFRAAHSASDQAPVDIRPDTPAATAEPGKLEATTTTDEFQERDIVRLLLLYGDQELPDAQGSVASFVLADLSDSLDSFDHPLYGKFIQEYQERRTLGAAADAHSFINHGDASIKSLVVDLLQSPWEMSPNWIDRWNYPLQNQPVPELNFSLDMQQAMNRFKLRKIIRMCEINKNRIKQAESEGDADALNRYIRVHQKMLEVRSDLANKTGTVVLK